MRISDWSSDVCSSDLDMDRPRPRAHPFDPLPREPDLAAVRDRLVLVGVEEEFPVIGNGGDAPDFGFRDFVGPPPPAALVPREEIGRASCRERVCHYV